MNQEFITKTKTHEKQFLNNEIKIESKEDFITFKKTLLDLESLCEDKTLLGETETCVNYLKCLYQVIKKIEKNYHGNIKEEDLKTIMRQLQILWNFSRQSYFRKELVENYKLEEKEDIPYVDVRDILNKDYRIKQVDCDAFDASCKLQNDLYNEYLQVYTCVFKSREEKIKLLEEYLNDAKRLRKEFLEGKIQITNLKQWSIFAFKLKEFIKNSVAIHDNLMEINHLKIKKNVDESFIDFVFLAMQKIEEKYGETIKDMDLSSILDKILLMCKYQFLTEEKDSIIDYAMHNKEEEAKEEVYTSSYQVVSIDQSKAELWKKLNQEQKTLEEEYKEVYSFVFGKNLEQENLEKRGL